MHVVILGFVSKITKQGENYKAGGKLQSRGKITKQGENYKAGGKLQSRGKITKQGENYKAGGSSQPDSFSKYGI